ncbi:MAG: histidine kinase [Chitinophagaceae bacterium]
MAGLHQWRVSVKERQACSYQLQGGPPAVCGHRNIRSRQLNFIAAPTLSMRNAYVLFYWFFILLLLCSSLPAAAQYEEKNFTRYTVKDGLSDNTISCLRQDDQGYMWIGTDDGLNRFDGNAFRKYYPAIPPLNLSSGAIWRLKKTGPDQLGILTRNGFVLLNTKDYTVAGYRISDTTPISAYLNADWDAVPFPDNTYGVSSATGFYVYDHSGRVVMRHDAFTAKDIGKERLLYGRDILQLTDDRYIVYVNETNIAVYDHAKRVFREMTAKEETENHLTGTPFKQGEYWSFKYQLAKGEFVFMRGRFNQAVYYNHSTGKVVSSLLDKRITDSVSWESKLVPLNDSVLALNSGVSGFYLLRVNRQTGVITCDGKKFLAGYKINCLYYDRDNRLWAGTTEGLLKQELEPPVINALYYPPPGGIKLDQGFSTVYRYKGRIYAGRFAYNKGLAVIDAATMKVIKDIDLFSGNSSWNEIRSIEMYHPDTLWLGTNSGLAWFDTKTDHYGTVLDKNKYPWSEAFYPVLAPARADGYAWMCSMMNGKVIRYHIPTRTFTLFTPQTSPALPFSKVKAVVYDAYGDVWISGHSLARWNNRRQAFDTLITVYGGENKYNDDIITIRADNNGSLWLTNAGNGLLEYRIREKRFVAYSMKEGLPSNAIGSFSPVIDDKLWLAGNNQLCLFDIKSKQFTVYDYRDGLPEHKPTSRKIYYDNQSGYLYICYNEYLVRFHHSPPKARDRSSDLLIGEVKADNNFTYYSPGDKISIPHDRNNLAISCTVIDFDKGNYRFAWQLNGSGNWNSIGSERTINLSNLPPGKYALEIKASGKPGVEKRKSFSILIKPPFWKTAWFISLVLLLAGSAFYYIYRKRIHYIRQRADIDKQLSQTEMKALQAQMNPHFIFNSLNSIREMILSNENKEASHYLSKFAHLIRITLDQSTQPMVSLRNTVDYLKRYLEMENIRNSQLTYEITADDRLDTDETVVPPMLIQPFIENALWHGVSAGNRSIHIKVIFARKQDKLLCMIDDNGIGINQSLQAKTGSAIRHRSHGIQNIKDRIALLNEKYGLHAQVDIRDKKEIPGAAETGTIVTLFLPLEMANT